MVVYLTSSFISIPETVAYGTDAPKECYGFFDDLKKEWPDAANLLYVPCDPTAFEENESQLRSLLDAFEKAELKVNEVHMLEEDTGDTLHGLISKADVIYLAGGHTPTQLAFMRRINLKDALLNYKGIIIGLGAGSINAAYSVYLMPELDGEATDPNYVRFLPGLDLSNIQ